MPSTAAAVIDVFEKHGIAGTSIEVVAAALHLPVRTLQTALAHERMSFRDLRRQRQINRAMTLLAGTDLSIAKIAERAGYANHSNFLRAFRAVAGNTPSGYRAAHSKPIAQ